MEATYLRMIKNMKEDGPLEWNVYILRCGDSSLYTGIAKDVEARLAKHQKGKGAAYTRTHLPVELVYRENGWTRSAALMREAFFKRMPKDKKEFLVKTFLKSGKIYSGKGAGPWKKKQKALSAKS